MLAGLGGATVGAGGLFVTSGGATVADGNIVLQDGVELLMAASKLTMNGATDGILVQNTDGTASQVGITVERASSSSSSFTFFEVKDNYDTSPTSIFTINADPSTTIGAGGLSVTGGVTVASGGLVVSGGGASVTGSLVGQSAAFSGTLSAYGISDLSDRRLKDDIAPIANRSRALLDLKGVRVQARSPGRTGRARQGFSGRVVWTFLRPTLCPLRRCHTSSRQMRPRLGLALSPRTCSATFRNLCIATTRGSSHFSTGLSRR